jgi:alpha(1,3/1,4) fucosyltransferase
VPIYLGAPDIARYVPAEAFINMREFHDYRELEAFLDGLDASAVARYVEAAQEFLRSEAYTPFTTECFARQIVNMLTDTVHSE